MPYYISIGEFQNQLTDYYRKNGKKLTFPEMTKYLYDNNLLVKKPIPREAIPEDEEDFYETAKNLLLTIDLQDSNPIDVRENDIIPEQRDVLIIRQFKDIKMTMHTHDYFEIGYVARGKCKFYNSKGSRLLKEGELVIIPPKILHEMVLEDESVMFCILLRKSTFDTVFFSLLSRNDLLSSFFRNTLQKGRRENFILFDTDNDRRIKNAVQNAYLECHKNDHYGNSCCISWINIMFSELLRKYAASSASCEENREADFSLILQYIQYNYKYLTLSSLAETFHYNESYLSTLIKQNTGFSFSEIIKRQRLAEAEKYLLNTEIKISEIAELIGYNSEDHFSRTFRSFFQVSPQKYRKLNRSKGYMLNLQ